MAEALSSLQGGVNKSHKNQDEKRTIKRLISCDVCHEIMLEPCTLNCGHSFCYTCLYEWFKKQDKWDPKTCPKCRTVVNGAPPISFVIRDVALALDNNKNAASKETLADIHKNTFGELFPGLFVLKPKPVYCDLDDGVRRCGNCHWEAQGSVCPHCGCRLVYRGLDQDQEGFSDEDHHHRNGLMRPLLDPDEEDEAENIGVGNLGQDVLWDDDDEEEEEEDDSEGSMVDFVEPDEAYDIPDSSFRHDRSIEDEDEEEEDDDDDIEQVIGNDGEDDEDDDEDMPPLEQPSIPRYRRVRTIPSVVVSDSDEEEEEGGATSGRQSAPIPITIDSDDDDDVLVGADEPTLSQVVTIPDNEEEEEDEDILGTRRKRKRTHVTDEDGDEIDEREPSIDLEAQDEEVSRATTSNRHEPIRQSSRRHRRRSSSQRQRNKLQRQWEKLQRRRSRV